MRGATTMQTGACGNGNPVGTSPFGCRRGQSSELVMPLTLPFTPFPSSSHLFPVQKFLTDFFPASLLLLKCDLIAVKSAGRQRGSIICTGDVCLSVCLSGCLSVCLSAASSVINHCTGTSGCWSGLALFSSPPSLQQGRDEL